MPIQAFIFCGKGSSLAPFTQPDFPFQAQNDDSAATANSDKLNEFAKNALGAGVINEFMQHSTRLPKALLPIGNRPMIEYVLIGVTRRILKRSMWWQVLTKLN